MVWALRAILFLVLALGLASCGGSPEPTGPGGRTPDFSDAEVWRRDSPWADVLLDCVDPRRGPRSCTFASLPPAGENGRTPTAGQLLDRLVVSHRWMGERLEEVLRQAPEDLLRALGAVSAIVVDADVRPSFYWPLTGALYLDARHLWITEAEEATVTRIADYRSGFGDGLGFRPFSLYLLDGSSAFGTGRAPRPLLGRVRAVSGLLFHEAAHANDFLPPVRRNGLDPDATWEEALEGFSEDRLSARLARTLPLRSQVWKELGGVLYRGDSPSGDLRALDARQAGAAFESDGANDPYAYSAAEEDLAMLFEELMLSVHLGLERRVGFLAVGPDEGGSCSDLEIGWGVDGRIGAPEVARRAAMAAQWILGRDFSEVVDSLAPPSVLLPGTTPCAQESTGTTASVPWS